jgi:hypothetical protein
MKYLIFSTLFLILLSPYFLSGQERQLQTENVFLITLDGLRWQELFYGADDSLIGNLTFVKDTGSLKKEFSAGDYIEKRQKLMPWFWSTLAKDGQIIGNRLLGNQAQVTNIHWFSYPGYNEILTGFSDPYIKSNDKIPNPNKTVLEWLHEKPEYTGRVAAFGSWDVFPYIINSERSGIPVNAGFDIAKDENLSWKENYLNTLLVQTHSPWSSVRLDVFTHHYALEYLQRKHPKVIYISYGETDDFAHDGRYDHYLHSARRTDRFIKELWDFCQQDPVYKDKTTFIITTDHGRGDIVKKEWTSHGKIFKGSHEIWMAFIGPDTPPMGERKDKGKFFQNQVAKTLAAFLGYAYENTEEVGEVVSGAMLK